MQIIWLLVFVLSASCHAETVPAADGPSGVEGVKTWARDRLKDADRSFGGTGRGRMPSPGFWGDEVVYQIQVDRFNRGDFRNDRLKSEHQIRNEGKTDVGLPDYRHGGDLQGIIDRLDYLKHLGITSLWITPVFKNGDGSYHGYCTSDFTQVDPGFGSNELFRELVSQAHNRGMRVVLDIVVNHMCDQTSGYDNEKTPFQPWAYNECVRDLDARDWKGETRIRGQRELKFGKSFFGPFRSQHFFSRCGYKAGDFSSQGAAAMFGDFSPLMFDFDTNNWDFQKVFTDLHNWWIAYADVDGFRVDAAKHVTADFIARFSTETREYARRLGKQNFLLVGEVAAGAFDQALRVGRMRSNVYDPGSSGTIPQKLREILPTLKDTYLSNSAWALPGLNAVYDFSQSGGMGEMWRHTKSPLAHKQHFFTGGESDHSQCGETWCELGANGDTRLNWNVLEIHDWPRLALWKASLGQMMGAAGHLLTSRGTPVLYYGYEQGLNGDCHHDKINVASSEARDEVLRVCGSADTNNHARYRQDMFASGKWRLGSQVPEINGLAGIGKPLREGGYGRWWEDPYLRTDHWLYKSIRKLVAIRKSCSAIRYGEIYFRAAHDRTQGGLLAFSRIDNGMENLVLLNSSENAIPLSALFIDSNINRENGRMWKNLLNGFEQGWVGDLGGGKGLYFKEGFQLQPHSVAVFVDAGNVSEYRGDLETHLCNR